MKTTSRTKPAASMTTSRSGPCSASHCGGLNISQPMKPPTTNGRYLAIESFIVTLPGFAKMLSKQKDLVKGDAAGWATTPNEIAGNEPEIDYLILSPLTSCPP